MPQKHGQRRSKVMFQARITVEAEKRRLRLLRALGDPTNGALVERGLLLLEEYVAEGRTISEEQAEAAA